MPHYNPVSNYVAKILGNNALPENMDEQAKFYAVAVLLLGSKKGVQKQAAAIFPHGFQSPILDETFSILEDATLVDVTSRQKIEEKYRFETRLSNEAGDSVCFLVDFDERGRLLNIQPASIRIINDPTLHQPGSPFPSTPTPDDTAALIKQIAIAKKVLIATGGAGIAANQCAAIEKPYAFAIVGIFKDSEEHVKRVSLRYPNANFPEAMVMVNPQILAQSASLQRFKHACLSVPGVNRCEVQSPEWIEISYLDAEQGLQPKHKKLYATDAVVLWHEMQHILFGNTYFDVTIAHLDNQAAELFLQLAQEERKQRKEAFDFIPDVTILPQSFCYSVIYDSAGQLWLDTNAARRTLQKMSDQTLFGIIARLEQAIMLKKNATTTYNGFFAERTEGPPQLQESLLRQTISL